MRYLTMRLFAVAMALALAIGVVTLPVFSASYLKCNGPLKGWRQLRDGTPHLAIVVTIRMGRNKSLWWNGQSVSWGEFRKLLRRSATSNPTPFLVLDPNPSAECKNVNEVRYEMEKVITCSKGGCGEGHGRWLDGGEDRGR